MKKTLLLMIVLTACGKTPEAQPTLSGGTWEEEGLRAGLSYSIRFGESTNEFAERRCTDGSCTNGNGTYRVSGDEVTITFGSSQTCKFSLTQTTLEMCGNQFRRTQ